MVKKFFLFFLVLLPTIALADPNIPKIEGMVFVKGGCFEMGDTFGDGDKEPSGEDTLGSDEKPVHAVCLDDFYIGKYEVTQRQWTEVMGSNPSDFKNCDDCPVEQVSWDDALEFLNKLSKKDGKQQYRLPTEAEWEYAARSGGKKEKCAGTSDKSHLGEYEWYNANSGNKTHPVGQKKPNGLGLYDMSGNVWEWVQDKYAEDYYRNSRKNNPKGPSSSSTDRVLRGGSWFNLPWFTRASARYGYFPDHRTSFIGFRFVRTK